MGQQAVHRGCRTDLGCLPPASRQGMSLSSPFDILLLALASVVKSSDVRLKLAAEVLLCGAQRWEAFMHLRVWDCWRRYFRYRGIVPMPPFLEPGKHYLFVHMPHAVRLVSRLLDLRTS